MAYGREGIVLTRHGRKVAGIVPMSDILRLREVDGHNPMMSIQSIPEGVSTKEHLVKALERELGLSGE